jgi:hypothetical protein
MNAAIVEERHGSLTLIFDQSYSRTSSARPSRWIISFCESPRLAAVLRHNALLFEYTDYTRTALPNNSRLPNN